MLHWDTVHTDLQAARNNLEFTGLLCPGPQKKTQFHLFYMYQRCMSNVSTVHENVEGCVFAVCVENSAVPSVLCDELEQIFGGNLVALLFEERREARFPIHHALVVLKY